MRIERRLEALERTAQALRPADTSDPQVRAAIVEAYRLVLEGRKPVRGECPVQIDLTCAYAFGSAPERESADTSFLKMAQTTAGSDCRKRSVEEFEALLRDKIAGMPEPPASYDSLPPEKAALAREQVLADSARVPGPVADCSRGEAWHIGPQGPEQSRPIKWCPDSIGRRETLLGRLTVTQVRSLVARRERWREMMGTVRNAGAGTAEVRLRSPPISY
jgi:hypothetical protein